MKACIILRQNEIAAHWSTLCNHVRKQNFVTINSVAEKFTRSVWCFIDIPPHIITDPPTTPNSDLSIISEQRFVCNQHISLLSGRPVSIITGILKRFLRYIVVNLGTLVRIRDYKPLSWRHLVIVWVLICLSGKTASLICRVILVGTRRA